MRLQSFLSKAGIASRRGVVEDIQAGKVSVNGEMVDMPSHAVDPDQDVVLFNGRRVILRKKAYFMFHKPKGIISSVTDPHHRATVLDFFRHVADRIFPVGRLDQDSTGLLLLTNDGELTFQLTHPKFGVKKVYDVFLDRKIARNDVRRLEQGVFIQGYKTAPCTIKVNPYHGKQLEIIMGEGRKRQIRLMFASLGYQVMELHRKAYGPLTLNELKPGKSRKLTETEVELLWESIGKN